MRSLIAKILIVGVTILMYNPFIAYAAPVEIDASADATDTQWNFSSPTHVWISDTEGFVIYQDVGTLDIASTTDSGATWGNFTTISSQSDIIRNAVWYDQWTAGDSGTKIHIVFADTGVDDTYYIEYDTITNVASSEIRTATESATLAAAANDISITKGTDGALYVTAVDAADSWVHKCTTTCTSAVNWSAITDPWGTADGNDGAMLFPLAGGDIMLVQQDTSADDVESNVWNGSTWSGWNTGIDQDVPDETTYDFAKLSGTVGTTTGDVYIAYCDDCNDFLTQDHDIEVWKYNAGSWTQLTNVITNASGGIQEVSMAIDKGNDVLYVAYIRRTTINSGSTANIYYASSTDDGSTWSAESSAINDVEQTIRGLNLNIVNNERISVTWKYIGGANDNDFMHETIEDLSGLAYEDGDWISPSWDIGSITSVDDSFIDFSSTTPSDTTVAVQTCVNTSATVPCSDANFDNVTATGKIQVGSSGGDITGDLSGKYLWIRVALGASTDGADTPTVSQIIVAINQAAAPPVAQNLENQSIYFMQ